MKILELKLLKTIDNSYPIYLGSGIFREVLEKNLEKALPTAAAFISDSRVASIYLNEMKSIITGCPSCFLSFVPGENRKNIGTVMRLFKQLVKNKLDRKSIIIAAGGGVTGDISGFLASVYLRGIPFIQVPTSLLAMVDSSIGGKTGVDSKEGKNLIGSFYQPEAVIIDMKFLSTLPRREFLNGMAEIIKHSLIRDFSYFELLRENKDKILLLNQEILTEVVERSCRIKASVVEEDEREGSLRQILNFGHTAGHAIEIAGNFRIPHGYALAIGMMVESYISFKRGLLSSEELNMVLNLIKYYELDGYIFLIKGISAERISRSALTDKKNINREIKTVLLKKIGEVYEEKGKFSFPIGRDEIESGLDYISRTV